MRVYYQPSVRPVRVDEIECFVLNSNTIYCKSYSKYNIYTIYDLKLSQGLNAIKSSGATSRVKMELHYSVSEAGEPLKRRSIVLF
jgi:hypothetical protein